MLAIVVQPLCWVEWCSLRDRPSAKEAALSHAEVTASRFVNSLRIHPSRIGVRP